MKKALSVVLLVSCFSLTGCLEEILASLCNKLASNDSIILTLNGAINYSDKFAVVTYSFTPDGSSGAPENLMLSQCEGDFTFPAGEIKFENNNLVSFTSVLDANAQSFFFDEQGVKRTGVYQVNIDWHSQDDCSEGSFENNISGGIDPVWRSALELPPEASVIDQCEITGQSASVAIEEIN